MIPKIIHLCWISGDPYPPLIQKCIDSWHRFLPEYKIMIWDYEKVHQIGSKWVEEAIKVKKYSFAADYVRFYALYNYGGIYLDSDVEVLKSFDDLLNLRYFIGKENSGHLFEAAIIGSEAKQAWVKKCLNYYKHRSFINIYGQYNVQVLPYVMEKQLNKRYKFVSCKSIDEYIDNEGMLCYFPVDWFSPKSWDSAELNVTDNTYCIHHFQASWKETPNEIVSLNNWIIFLRRCRKIGSFIKHNIFR